jgi:hypothetical protein
VGRGIYVPDDGTTRRRSDAFARILGLHAQTDVEHCFSHESAALVHGLPLWLPSTVTHLYQRTSPSSRSLRTISRHVPLPPATDVVVVDGLPVTSPSRTVWDCATTMRPLDALVIADAALAVGMDLAELTERAARSGGRRGVARARDVIALADGGSESPWETACRFALLRAGFPPPQTQVEVATRLGTFWADLGWAEWRVVIEYDGRSKYAGGEDELMREKRRHDAIVEADWRVVRATREDLRVRGSLAARVRRLLPPEVAATLRPRPTLT